MTANPLTDIALQDLPATAPQQVNDHVLPGGLRSLRSQQQTSAPPALRPAPQLAPTAPELAEPDLRRPSNEEPQKEWLKVANALTMILLAAAGLVAAFVFGKMAEKTDSQNLQATLWRDCIDLADQIGETPTCRKLIDDGFDSLSSKRYVKRQRSPPTWYESDTGIVSFLRELGLPLVQMVMPPFLFITLITLDFVRGCFIWIFSIIYSGFFINAIAVLSLVPFVATYLEKTLLASGFAKMVNKWRSYAMARMSSTEIEIKGCEMMCIYIFLGLCANEWLYRPISPQNSYYIGRALIEELPYACWCLSLRGLISPEYRSASFLTKAASVMRIQNPGVTWPWLRFAEPFYWSILICLWPSAFRLHNKAERIDVWVHEFESILAPLMIPTILISVILILPTIPVSRELLALLYLWLMTVGCLLAAGTRGILRPDSTALQTEYISYRYRMRRQINLIKQKLIGQTHAYRGELETSLSIFLSSVPPNQERTHIPWLDRISNSDPS